MHDTLHSLVKGNIDNKVIKIINGIQILYCKGWAFNAETGVIKMRVKTQTNNDINESYFDIKIENRQDVAHHYQNYYINDCGWSFEVPFTSDLVLQGMIAESEWVDLFHFDMSKETFNFKIKTDKIPTFIVVDDFYEDPDSVRRYALQQDFILHPSAHKGRRTDTLHKFEGLKERFEHLLGCKIKNWDHYATNCCFQYCVAGDQLVYHQDFQQYAGVLFLTPNAPAECGTQIYRSKLTGKISNKSGPEFDKAFSHGFLDRTKFELIDTVGNVYNRLVLFDAHSIHAASEYFGNSKEDGRMFQLFFFDLDV